MVPLECMVICEKTDEDQLLSKKDTELTDWRIPGLSILQKKKKMITHDLKGALSVWLSKYLVRR